IFLNLMFTVVVPLVFVSVANAVGSMMDMKRLGKILGYMLLVFVVTGVIAAVIIIFAVKVFPPAQGVIVELASGEGFEPVSLPDAIVNALTVGDFSELLSRSHMLPLIVFAILFGACVGMCGGKETPVGKLLENLSEIMMQIVNIIMMYAPIGLAAYFAALIGEFGPQLLGTYARAMALYYPLCALYLAIMFPVYSYYAAGKLGVSRMWRYIWPPAITAFATGSSIATLPVNLEASQNIGVSKDVREIVLPIGATMHMDGSVLSAILKISILFGVFGYEFSGIGTYLTAIVIAVLSGVVMSGIPGGGLIGEMLIVSLYGFPAEAFPIIATIGFLVDPPATCLNAAGDTIASMMVTRLLEGKDWLRNKVKATEEAA
ncbi:MAG: dicarboxylate/amino acid:cation symporter, partial [Eubacteriales bacterium]|nr:dicarboxylate/amino acid:cation symporter [Eubacteriales bacterium]